MLMEQDAEWWLFSQAFRLESLRIAENLLGLKPGDGHLALRTIHSLVHVPTRSSASNGPDYDLSRSGGIENYGVDDEIWFYYKSFIDYLVDPSRALEYYVDLRQMHMRLALSCLDTMQTFSLQPASRIACSMFFRSLLQNFKPHVNCSYLGLCDIFLGSSLYWVRSSPATVVTSYAELRRTKLLS
jgi:hypothetical protein